MFLHKMNQNPENFILYQNYEDLFEIETLDIKSNHVIVVCNKEDKDVLKFLDTSYLPFIS